MSYYDKKYIQYLLLEGCRDRDFSALGEGNIRGLSVKCLFDLNRALKLIGWERHRQDLYVGCAKLKEIPKFIFNPKKRSKETKPWYKKKYSDYVKEYDLFFDFDKEPKDSWDSLVKDVKILKEYLDEYKVRYYVVFSGNKGMQVIIDGKYLPIDKIDNGNVQPHKTISERIKKMLDLKFLDLANNGVNSRLRKLPYSLVGENIALPLDDNQIENFNIDEMKKDFIMEKVPLIRRGYIERFEEISDKEGKENLRTFIKMFDFKGE